MNLTIEDIARAISGHHFEAAYQYLNHDVTWTLVGDETVTGREEVIRACERSAAYLSGVTTEFRRFRTLVGDTWVVIDSLAQYTDSERKLSVVASCDVYDFDDGKLSEISSYNIELTDD